MRTGRTMELKRFLMAGLIVVVLVPLFFGGVRSVKAAIITVCASGCDYTTIQDAVTNAPDGSTVEVKAGTYVEQVKITKNLILLSTEGAIINPPETILPACSTSLINYPLICAEPLDLNTSINVTVDGFTIDGMDRSATVGNYRYFGIAYHNVGGVIQNNVITGIKGVENNNSYMGVGIYVTENDKNISLNVDILGNTISDFHKNAISLTTQTWPTPLTFLIKSNTITGTPNATVAQNGIQVNAPNSGGIIRENTITNISYNNAPTVANPNKAPLVAAGILNISTPADSLDNVISNSQVGILYFNDITDTGNYRAITGNQIEVLKPGTLANPGRNVYGILVTDRSKDILSPIDPPVILNSLNAQLNAGSLYVLVNDNTVIYTGALPNTKTFGIEIDAAVGDNLLTVDVLRNQIGALNDGFDVGLAFYQCGPDNLPPDPTITDCGTGSLEDSLVLNNNISGNNYGVFAVGPVGQSKLDGFHHNRIAANGVGFQNNTGLDILAINNWWGCNEGPGAPGCDTLINNSDPAYADPWLTLTATMDPSSVPSGMNSTMTASLDINSNAENTSASNTGPVNTTANFSANLGTFTPVSSVFVFGEAGSTYTAPTHSGPDQVCVTVDNAEVCKNVTILPPFIFSSDLVGPYTTGAQQEFSVTLDNANGANFTNVLAHFRIAGAVPADIASLEYFETSDSTWHELLLAVDGSDLVGDYGPPIGFPMPTGYNATSLFRVTFNTARTYDVVISLSDLSPDPDVTLASFTATAVVEAPQSFTIFLPLISR